MLANSIGMQAGSWINERITRKTLEAIDQYLPQEQFFGTLIIISDNMLFPSPAVMCLTESELFVYNNLYTRKFKEQHFFRLPLFQVQFTEEKPGFWGVLSMNGIKKYLRLSCSIPNQAGKTLSIKFYVKETRGAHWADCDKEETQRVGQLLDLVINQKTKLDAALLKLYPKDVTHGK